MTDDALKETIIRMAEPVATALGLVIWGVEITRAGRTVVRLFVDVPFSSCAAETSDSRQSCDSHTDISAEADEPSLSALSATLDQCEEISRTLGLALEVEDSIPEAYVLEVSTPGLTRLFFSLDQMRHYLGDVVEARLLTAVAVESAPGETPDPAYGGPRRVWRGTLQAVHEDAFTLEPVSITPEGEVVPENLPPARIPWSAVRRASRMYIFKQPQKPGKGPAKSKGGKSATAKEPKSKSSEKK